MTAEQAGPVDHAAQPDSLPLGCRAVSDEVWSEGVRGEEALTVVLQQVTTCLGGLGALAHWRDRAAGRLRLVTTKGLARASADAWADLREEQDVAPARAVR